MTPQPHLIVDGDLDGYVAALALLQAVPGLTAWTRRDHETCRELQRRRDDGIVVIVAATLSLAEQSELASASRAGTGVVTLGATTRTGPLEACPALAPGETARSAAALRAITEGDLGKVLGRPLRPLTSEDRTSLQRLSDHIAAARAGEEMEIALLLGDVLGDHRDRYLPREHALHHRFVGEVLRRVHDLAKTGRSLADVEPLVARVRHGVIDDLITTGPKEPGQLSNLRLIRTIAEDPATVHRIETEMGSVAIAAILGHPCFEQIARMVMDLRGIDLVVGFDSPHDVVLISRHGLAQELAPRFGATGTGDRAVVHKALTLRHDRTDIRNEICRRLGVDTASRARIAMILTEDAVTYDILEDGLPLRLKGRVCETRKRFEAVLMVPGSTREASYEMLARLKSGTRVHIEGFWTRPQPGAARHTRAEFHADALTIPANPAEMTA